MISLRPNQETIGIHRNLNRLEKTDTSTLYFRNNISNSRRTARDYKTAANRSDSDQCSYAKNYLWSYFHRQSYPSLRMKEPKKITNGTLSITVHNSCCAPIIESLDHSPHKSCCWFQALEKTAFFFSWQFPSHSFLPISLLKFCKKISSYQYVTSWSYNYLFHHWNVPPLFVGPRLFVHLCVLTRTCWYSWWKLEMNYNTCLQEKTYHFQNNVIP